MACGGSTARHREHHPLDEANEERDPSAEVVGGHIRDVADVMVSHDVDAIGMPPAAMSREKRTQVMRCVEAREASSVKGSAEQVAGASDLSHDTTPRHLEEIRDGEAGSHAED